MKKSIIFLSALSIFFISCTKKYEITNVYKNIDSTKSIIATQFPLNIKFDCNKIIFTPNLTNQSDIYLDITDSLIGCTIDLFCYVNQNSSVSIGYKQSTILYLTEGSFTNPIQGNNLIEFKYLGNFNGVNIITSKVVLQ